MPSQAEVAMLHGINPHVLDHDDIIVLRAVYERVALHLNITESDDPQRLRLARLVLRLARENGLDEERLVPLAISLVVGRPQANRLDGG
jgi:hypothetical protein